MGQSSFSPRQSGVVVWWQRHVWLDAVGVAGAETEMQTVQCSA